MHRGRAVTATVGHVDKALCEYIDNLFLDGASTAEALRVQNGFCFVRRSLCRSRALASFTRQH